MNTPRYLALGVVGAIVIELTACATVPKRIQRDSQTYTAEVMSSLAREKEAYTALMAGAEAAVAVGDAEVCASFATPALTIEVYAESQAMRALWLAGLPYPKPDGSLPEPGEEQDDPAEVYPEGRFTEVSEEIVGTFCDPDDEVEAMNDEARIEAEEAAAEEQPAAGGPVILVGEPVVPEGD